MASDDHFWTQNSLIKDLLKDNFKDSNTKISKEALKTYCHFLELFVKEGYHRSLKLVGEDEKASSLEFEHLEQVFVQLFLDF